MTDMTQTHDLRDRYRRPFTPMQNVPTTEALVCRKDILQGALGGIFSHDTSIEHLFDWLERAR